MNGGGRRARVVMYVRNDVQNDARVLREAATLAEAGHVVTIVGRGGASAGPVEREARAGFEIIRVREDRAWVAAWRRRLDLLRAPWHARHRVRRGLTPGASPAERRTALRLVAGGLAAGPWIAYRAADRLVGGGRFPVPGRGGELDRYVIWREDARHWAAAASAIAPPADVHHGHDLAGLLAARLAADRAGGRLVYDSHDLATQAVTMARRPRLVRLLVGEIERQAAREAAAVVTVNHELAAELRSRLRPRRLVVVHNCPPRSAIPAGEPSFLRDDLRLPATTPLVVYHGGFMHDRGIEEMIAALRRPELADVHGVFLGYGPLRDALRARAAEELDGRLHVLDAVAPDLVPSWIAGADVGIVCIQPSTKNHRLATPNKLFECLAAGLPVVASDFPAMRRIVLGGSTGPLGLVCDPREPAAIAHAVRELLDLPAGARSALRDRVRRAAAERWNWESEEVGLLRLYDDLAADPGRGPDPRA